MKLVSIVLLLTLATGFGKEPLTELIEKLVLLKSDVTVEGEKTYLKNDAIVRINGAGTSLFQAGRDAWPILLRHLDDKRESIASREVKGPYNVGHQCHWILSAQVVDLPKGYIKSKTREGKDGNWHTTPGMYYSFVPDLKGWFLKRGDRTINEMKIEVTKDILTMNDKIGYPTTEEETRIRGILLQQIKFFEEQEAKEKQTERAVPFDGE